jgi:hypothetical protein
VLRIFKKNQHFFRVFREGGKKPRCFVPQPLSGGAMDKKKRPQQRREDKERPLGSLRSPFFVDEAKMQGASYLSPVTLCENLKKFG